MSNSNEFNWADADDDIIVPEQPAIACFTNPNGAIVLRQAGQYGMEDDHWVYFHSQHAVAIAYAILDAAGLTMQIAECLPNGYRDVPRPGVMIELMEAARPDIDWPVVHHDFDAGEAPDNTGIDQIKKPKDRTGAERQKRYREKKKRNGHGVTRNVDDRDALPLLAVAGTSDG